MFTTLAAAFLLIACGATQALAEKVEETAPVSPTAPLTVPTKTEIQAAIDRGLTFLINSQNPSGWWSTNEQPALTGLVLTAFNLDPSQKHQKNNSSELNRAFDFILISAQPDGSIHRGALINYNTCLSLTALATAGNPKYLPVIRAARAYIASTQIDQGVKGKIDTEFDGGVGYGSKYDHSDMNNTLVALEAMRVSEPAEMGNSGSSANPSAPADLNWNAAIHFLQQCQNLPSHNTGEKVSDRPEDRGGFYYYPGNSLAGETTDSKTGRVSLRSYGSMSYAGLLSYIYAKLGKDDPRVKAVLDWTTRNYTLDENPGMGAQGYYYYLHLLTKALTAAQVETVDMPDGTHVKWREAIARKLIALQRPGGFWVNAEKRWWEVDPNLVTAYAVMALEILEPKAPQS